MGEASMDMDISMNIHVKSVDIDIDAKFHTHGKPEKWTGSDEMTGNQAG